MSFLDDHTILDSMEDVGINLHKDNFSLAYNYTVRAVTRTVHVHI